MPKQRKPKIDKRLLILCALTLVLIVICGALTLALVHKTKTMPAEKTPSISLGPMQYRFVNGKAVMRDDASVKSLKTFLEADASHEGCTGQSPDYEHVIAYTKDETQVFIKYGCGAADSPIYAVKTHNVWRMISPTNHFDAFEIPDCTYLTDNNISKEIAPVCSNGTKYIIR